jgi:hypothetical protein
MKAFVELLTIEYIDPLSNLLFRYIHYELEKKKNLEMKNFNKTDNILLVFSNDGTVEI